MNKVNWQLTLHYVFLMMLMASFGELIEEDEKSNDRFFLHLFSLLDPESEMEIMSYRVCQILFCARGPSNSPLSYCWAFTTSRPSTVITPKKSSEEALYQCQVFRCENQDAVRYFSFRIRFIHLIYSK